MKKVFKLTARMGNPKRVGYTDQLFINSLNTIMYIDCMSREHDFTLRIDIYMYRPENEAGQTGVTVRKVV